MHNRKKRLQPPVLTESILIKLGAKELEDARLALTNADKLLQDRPTKPDQLAAVLECFHTALRQILLVLEEKL